MEQLVAELVRRKEEFNAHKTPLEEFEQALSFLEPQSAAAMGADHNITTAHVTN